MADPITIIGAVGAICNIVEAVTKTIATINLLRSRWKEADLSLASLTAQLVALRAALSKIQEWVDLEVNETHHQLTMDLDISVSCCKILADRLEAIFNEAARVNNNPRDILGKLKVVYGIGALDELQKLVERQTGSLTLLLTACNCKAISEQKQLLEKPRSRIALDRVKSDSASLMVHRDGSSMLSRRTDNLSKLSAKFKFDGLVFASRVYEKVFRSMVKNGLRRPNRRLYTEEGSLLRAPVSLHRKEANQTLKQHAPKSSLESAREANERANRIVGVQPSRDDPHRGRAAAVLLSEDGATDTLDRVPTLAKDPNFDRISVTKAHVLLTGADYIGVRYVKTCFDDALGNAFEVDRFSRLSTTLRTFLSDKSRCSLHVMHQNDTFHEKIPSSPSLIVFCVDLSHYDHPWPERGLAFPGILPQNKFYESLIRFRQIINLANYETSPVLLLLRSHEGFSDQLQSSPAQRFFPGLSADSKKAIAFIQCWFLKPWSIRNPERVTTYVLNKLEPSSADKILDVEAFAEILSFLETTKSPISPSRPQKPLGISGRMINSTVMENPKEGLLPPSLPAASFSSSPVQLGSYKFKNLTPRDRLSTRR